MTLTIEQRIGSDRVGPVKDWAKVEWLEQVNTPTGGTITLPSGSTSVEFLNLAALSADVVGLLITDDETGHQVPVYVVEEVAGSGATVNIPFLLDVALFNEVPAFPDPATPLDPWATAPLWTATGDAVSATGLFLVSHGGPGSHADYRRFESITQGASAGVTVSYSARMGPSLDVVRETVSGAAIVSARLEDGLHRAFIRGPADRPDALFSPDLHTVTDWEFRNKMPAANTFFGGGAGEGTAREIAIAATSTAEWPRRRGRFLDRGTLSGAELSTAAIEAAAWEGPTLTATVIETAGLYFGTDFLLGDTVRAQIAGREFALPVTTVKTTATQAGVDRKVALGAPVLDTRPDLQLHRMMLRNYGFEVNP